MLRENLLDNGVLQLDQHCKQKRS